jgi:alpha-beta hydrolase superfamily lysophospholipase
MAQPTELLHDDGPVTRPNGPRLYFYSTFPRDRPKAVVAMVHGYGDHAGRYVHVADAFAERGIASVRIDLRGHGRADGPRGYCSRFDEFIDDMSVLDRLVTERAPDVPPFLFGHSFGGLVATSYALPRQDRWRSLLLSAPYFGLAMKVPALKRTVGELASKIVPRLALPSGLHGDALTHDAARAREYDQDPLIFESVTARWFTEAQAAQGRVLAQAASIRLPLYVVMGTLDPVADVNQARAVFAAAGSTDKTFDVREGLFHEPWNETEWPSVVDGLGSWILSHTPA